MPLPPFATLKARRFGEVRKVTPCPTKFFGSAKATLCKCSLRLVKQALGTLFHENLVGRQINLQSDSDWLVGVIHRFAD